MAKYTNSPIVKANLAAILGITRSDLPDTGSGIYPFMCAENTGINYVFDPDSTTIGFLPTSSATAGRWIPTNREILQVDRTYFVRTDGNDANTGLANTSGGAFLTAAAARNAIRKIDGNGFNVSVQFGDGTYTSSSPLEWSGFIGVATLFLVGNTTVPVSVDILTSTGTWAGRGIWEFSGDQQFDISGFRFTNDQSNAYCLIAQKTAKVNLRRNIMAQAGYAQIGVLSFAYLEQIGNFSISGNPPNCIYASQSSVNFIQSGTGSVAFNNFSEAFANITDGAVFRWNPSLFTWTTGAPASGKRYSITANGVIQTLGVTGNLPGSIAGTTGSGGQYV